MCLPFLTKSGGYCPWKSHSHCLEDLNDANLLEVASALLYIEDMQHVLRIMVGGCGQQCMRGSGHCKSFYDFRDFQGVFLHGPNRHVISRTSKTEPFSSTSTVSIVVE